MTPNHVTPAGTSVLDELGLDANYVMKAKLAIRIQRSIAEMGLSQHEVVSFDSVFSAVRVNELVN